MKLLEKLGGEFKALGAELKSRPFSAYGGATYGGGYGVLPGYGLPFTGALPGSQYDDHTAAGVLWENPAAAACFVALTKAFAQARPYLEKRVKPDSNEWKRCDHPIIELLERPNAYYSGEKMFGVTLVCAMSQGAAFWRFERDRKGDVSEIWYEPPVGLGATGIAPNWDRQHFIKDFYYFVDGQRSHEPIPREDVIYFRHGLNVANPRLPWSPLGLGAREIAVLNSASSYTSAVMRNHGMPAGFVSMDGGGLSSSTPPTPEQAESLKAQIENKFGGPHNAGKTFVSSLPWKWNKVGMTPAEMVIDKIRQWPQETVCALLGTPVIVALLPTGEQPTYQNLDASMRWWWDNTIIPLEDAFADEIETQMFPAFGLDAANYRLAWDRSKIPALQEDESAKHAMWREDYRAGGIDRYTYLTKIGEQADEKLKGVLHPSATPKSEENATPEAGDNQKRWAAELKDREFHETDWVRKHGKFERFIGSRNLIIQNQTFEWFHQWTGDPSLAEESQEFQEAKAAAMKKLIPYAAPGNGEVGIVLVKSSGAEYSRRSGTEDRVEVLLPTQVPVATLHTHPADVTPSPRDLASILTRPNIEQSHVVAPTKTYSLHRMPGRIAKAYADEYGIREGFTKEIFEDNLAKLTREYRFGMVAIDAWSVGESIGGPLEPNNEVQRYDQVIAMEEVMSRMARKYGIMYRIGERKMDYTKSLADDSSGKENSSESLSPNHADLVSESVDGVPSEVPLYLEDWNEFCKHRAAMFKAVLDLRADAVEKAERLGTEVEPIRPPTNEEMIEIEANFTDADWKNFLAMRANDGSPDLHLLHFPTVEEYEKATGRRLRLKRDIPKPLAE